MANITYSFGAGDALHQLDMVWVEGTGGRPYTFGERDSLLAVELPGYFISRFTVTQALWTHVTGANPSVRQGERRPVENVSWLDVAGPGGFLDRINAGAVRAHLASQIPGATGVRFRLPSETEWEYAARGGPHWAQGFRFSGSDDIDAVAWYDRNSGDSMHDVGRKAPNQLGIHDMSGNAWEWCQDRFTPGVRRIPADGSPFAGDGPDRVLRGGCFHNWAVHCTVSKRYEIAEDYRDGCIGFRLVLGAAWGRRPVTHPA